MIYPLTHHLHHPKKKTIMTGRLLGLVFDSSLLKSSTWRMKHQQAALIASLTFGQPTVPRLAKKLHSGTTRMYTPLLIHHHLEVFPGNLSTSAMMAKSQQQMYLSGWRGNMKFGFVVHEMLSNPDFKKEFDYAPYREYRGGKQRWSDFMSGNWSWRQAVSCLHLIRKSLTHLPL
jgi:hypothetical protein